MFFSLLRAWWPALLWSSLIFFASTDSFSSDHTGRIVVPMIHWLFPSMGDDGVELLHHLIRKSAHFVEYFIFFMLVYRGIRAGRKGFHWSWAFIAWGIAAVYSLSDEFHQTFVASRGASILDSLLDSAAALVALFVLFFVYRHFRRTRSAP